MFDHKFWQLVNEYDLLWIRSLCPNPEFYQHLRTILKWQQAFDELYFIEPERGLAVGKIKDYYISVSISNYEEDIQVVVVYTKTLRGTLLCCGFPLVHLFVQLKLDPPSLEELALARVPVLWGRPENIPDILWDKICDS